MQKIYLKYPEISELKANIASRKVSEDKTQVILDRTIFTPNSTYLLADKGAISDLPIINVEDRRDNIIHTIAGKVQKSEVILTLDMDIRTRNLVYNTAYILFTIFFESMYAYKDMSLELSLTDAKIHVGGFNGLFDGNLIEEQINFIIGKSLSISNKQGISSIMPLGEVINNEIAYDNTGKIRGFIITNISQNQDNLVIDFLAGADTII